MKFTPVVTILSAFALPAFAEGVFVVQDAKYSNPNASLSTVTCSGLTNLSSLSNIGGIPGVRWDTALCGSCWSLTSTPPCSGATIFFTIVDDDYNVTDASPHVDTSDVVYAVSPEAFNDLTRPSCQVDVVYAEATPVDPSMCGM
ncbi:uncharacterized protein EDB91DRAFT_694184 [Suillus paluster]|uniref:uncharacterized protein n=1 Tax=Suillus paluster TaxID=48578 RepID=UPI001B876C3C|nr:uncharacterized protein EDB91DRAFT_694184 [Suillus paluster]KAG1750540.1 hypothetical protein EDB91DRAFT_694184 [Suillus paluster]